MNKLAILLICLTALAGPSRFADAQVYPERVRTVSRHRTEAYQRSNDSREEQTERFTKTLRLGASGELDVANIAGDIVVTQGPGPDVTVDVIKTARSRSVDDAKSLLQLVQVDVLERGGRAEVRTRYPTGDQMQTNNRRNVNVSVSYNITAPVNTRLTVKSILGQHQGVRYQGRCRGRERQR